MDLTVNAGRAEVSVVPTKIPASELSITTTRLRVQLHDIDASELMKALDGMPASWIETELRRLGFQCRVTGGRS